MKTSLRFKFGIECVIIAMIFPLFGLLIPFLGLPLIVTGILVTLTMIGLPELFLFLGAVLAGKEAVRLITSKIKGIFRIKHKVKPISKWRHHLGVILLIVGLIPAIIASYIPFVMEISCTDEWLLLIKIIGDIILIISFFVLGEPFWEKLKGLFVYSAGGDFDQHDTFSNR